MSFETSQGGESVPATELQWREPFEWQEPPEWDTVSGPEELAEQILNDPKIEAGLWLLYNREKAAKIYGWPVPSHTPPAAEHYRHTYLWDAGFLMIILSRAALFAAESAGHLESKNEPKISATIEKLRDYSRLFMRAGVDDSFWVVNKQKPNGFIAGTQYAEGFKWYEIEKVLSIDRKDKSTHYSQPPVLPLAAMSVYKSMKETGDPNCDIYLEGMYRYLDNFMEFFQTDRRNSDDPLIGVIDPHETGWDSATRWDHKKPGRRPRNGPDTDPAIDEDNRYIDGSLAVMRQLDRFLWARNNSERLRRLFWENDLSMNAIYSHNLQVMAWLSDEMAERTRHPIYTQKATQYQFLAEELQQAMKDKMWFRDTDKVPLKGFYSLKADGEPNPDISPNNLFALMLPGLSEEQLTAILEMMDEHFDVEYPLNSTSTKSPRYDPGNQEADRLWRGPTWINANFYIVEFGLLQHAERTDISAALRSRCRQWAKRITESSNQLIDKNHPEGLRAETALTELAAAQTPEEVKQLQHITGAWEHYHPHTGAGQRPRVKNFAWTWLARFMTYSEKKAA